ncbi:MAG: hypothetical protein Q8S13_10965, partial [Dehalococcoidia bacterium]|nr:hypothetical protein [Dehalococcoidia bacterium]
GDAAAAVFRRQAQWLDALARHAIRVSGIGIIAAVLGIGVFLVLETLPLFAGARLSPGAEQSVAPGTLVFAAADEYQELAVAVGPEPALLIAAIDGSRAPERRPLEELEGHRMTAAGGSPELLALATDQGAVWLGRSPFTVRYAGGRRTVTAEPMALGVLQVAPGLAITQLAVREHEDVITVAAIAAPGHVLVTQVATSEPLIGPARHEMSSLALPSAGGEPTAIALDGRGTHALVGTAGGIVQRWRLAGQAPELLETIRAVGPGRISALAYMLGDRSVIVGGEDGSVATWSLIRDEASSDGFHLTKIHVFPTHQAPVTVVAASPRDKGFVTASEDGWARLHYMTNERTLAAWRLAGVPTALAFAPKLNGLLAGDADGRLTHWGL